MSATKLSSVAGFIAILACTVVAQAGAQQSARRGPPTIQVYSRNGVDVISTTSYVTPEIQVSENAYVFAVAMDLDGQIQVLHPDFPGISVKIVARRQLRLPNFFAGFNRQGSIDPYYSSAYYSGYDEQDSRGTVIALASRAPFNLEKIEVDGDWNMAAIRRLIEHRSPLAAAQALASYIGARGEPIGRDFMRFSGARRYNAYAYNNYDPCASYYGYAFGGYAFGPLMRAQWYSRLSALNQRGQRYRIVGYDYCGLPIVVPATRTPGTQFPSTRPPHRPGDTTVFPKARFPREGMPRHPRDAEPSAAPEGVFPLPRRSGLPQIGDVTITAPTGPRGEPRQILESYRPQPGTTSIPQGRAPIERPTTPRSEPIATGAPPAREHRPEPIVQSPPPSRAPETPRASPPPAPVVHERPSTPAPPPRTEKPTESPRVPPPNRN